MPDILKTGEPQVPDTHKTGEPEVSRGPGGGRELDTRHHGGERALQEADGGGAGLLGAGHQHNDKPRDGGGGDQAQGQRGGEAGEGQG